MHRIRHAPATRGRQCIRFGVLVILVLLHAATVTAAPATQKRVRRAGVLPASKSSVEQARVQDSGSQSRQVAPARDIWREARTLADAGNHTAAIALLDSTLRLRPDDNGLLWLRAAITSESGNDADAVVQYRRLLTAHPELGRDLRMDLARVLASMGKHREAADAYRDVLARDLNDREAQLGLAQNENWMGHHRLAAVLLEPLATGPNADPEAFKALAFARYWSGDGPAAREALRRHHAVSPGDAETQDLARRLRRESAAWVQIAYQRADDSDGLRVGTTTMELHAPLAERTMGAIGWGRDNVRDASGTRDPLTVWAGLEHMWSATWTARANVRHVDTGEDSGGAGMGEVSITWRPMDGLRVDGSVSRDVVLTRLALSEGISVQTWSLGADWSPFGRLVLHAAGGFRRYSDDNRAERLALSAVAPIFAARQGQVWAGVGAEQLNTRLDLDHGYYDPDYHVEWGPQVEADWWPSSTVTVSGQGRAGWQRDKGAEAQPFLNVEGSVDWVVADAWTLGIAGSRSNSNLESASGYERRSWRVALTRGF